VCGEVLVVGRGVDVGVGLVGQVCGVLRPPLLQGTCKEGMSEVNRWQQERWTDRRSSTRVRNNSTKGAQHSRATKTASDPTQTRTALHPHQQASQPPRTHLHVLGLRAVLPLLDLAAATTTSSSSASSSISSQHP
jgi:hypothetical protein